MRHLKNVDVDNIDAHNAVWYITVQDDVRRQRGHHTKNAASLMQDCETNGSRRGRRTSGDTAIIGMILSIYS